MSVSRGLPFHEDFGVQIGATLADSGREYCGIQERHFNDLPLPMEDIEHRTTKIQSPRSNGFVERVNRTRLDEHFRALDRQTWHIGVDQIERDFDRFTRR